MISDKTDAKSVRFELFGKYLRLISTEVKT